MKAEYVAEIIGVIYLARNLVNGSIYIGYSVDFRKRKKQHIQDAENGDATYFHNALRKYGYGNFSWSIIKRGPANELPRLEISAIAQYKTAGYKVYNLTDGGEGALGLRHTTESRARSSAITKELFLDPEYRAKHSAAQKKAANRPELKAKRLAATKTFWANPEARVQWSKIQKEVQNRPEVRAKKSTAQSAACQRPETIARMKESCKARWKRPGYVGNSKITEQMVIQLRQMRREGKNVKELMLISGLKETAVRKIIRRETWNHIP